MIVTTTRMKVAKENRSELIQTLLPLLGRVRGERGCLSSNLYQDVGDEGASLLVEEWDTQADWNNHLQTRECAIIMGAVSVLCNPQGVEFKLLVYRAGIEAMRESRAQYQ
jgi:quinol monooxygenase YgiN